MSTSNPIHIRFIIRKNESRFTSRHIFSTLNCKLSPCLVRQWWKRIVEWIVKLCVRNMKLCGFAKLESLSNWTSEVQGQAQIIPNDHSNFHHVDHLTKLKLCSLHRRASETHKSLCTLLRNRNTTLQLIRERCDAIKWLCVRVHVWRGGIFVRKDSSSSASSSRLRKTRH